MTVEGSTTFFSLLLESFTHCAEVLSLLQQLASAKGPEGIISVMHSSPREQFFLCVVSGGGNHQRPIKINIITE